MKLTNQEQTLLALIQKARTDKNTLAGKNTERGVELDGAYRIQIMQQADRPLKGYKLGLISPAKQEQMGIKTPLYGRIYPDMLRRGTISLSDFIQPRLEPEIALVLRDSIAPDASTGSIAGAVGGYFLGVDILDSVWQDYKFTAPEVVADNTSGGGFIMAERMSTHMPQGDLRLYLNGELQTEGHIVNLGSPVQQLGWLARTVGGLEASMIIFLGSPAAAIPAKPGSLEVADAEGNILMAKLV